MVPSKRYRSKQNPVPGIRALRYCFPVLRNECDIGFETFLFYFRINLQDGLFRISGCTAYGIK